MIGDTVVNFNESTSSEEIKFFLNISEAQIDELNPITVHKYNDCRGENIPNDVLIATAKQGSAPIKTSPGYGKVEVSVDAKIDNIVTNRDVFEYKADSDNEIAYLSFCVAANLGNIDVYNNEKQSMEDSSISYLHMLFNITISLSQGFNATSVDIVEIGPDNVDQSVIVNYNVLSCECVPSSKVCLEENEKVPYNQNSELNICVYTPENEDDIQIRDIKDMDLTEVTAGITLRAIENYQSNSITSVSEGNEKRMLVSTRIVSAFFTGLNDSEGTLGIEGTVTIEFVGSRKLMTFQQERGRVTQEEGDGEGTSEMEVNLSPGEEPTAESSSIHTHFTFMSSTVLLAFWMAVYGNWN